MCIYLKNIWTAGNALQMTFHHHHMTCFVKIGPFLSFLNWGRVTHICVGNLTIIGSDNGLSPGRRQAIIWTNARILSIGPLETNFNEILIEIYTFSFRKMHLKMSSGHLRPFRLGLNVLKLKYSCQLRHVNMQTNAQHRPYWTISYASNGR